MVIISLIILSGNICVALNPTFGDAETMLYEKYFNTINNRGSLLWWANESILENY